VPENVSIAYRGANYAIGQGPQFYGIWHAAAPQNAPLEWWPLTPEGWTGAWSRFASIEVPGTIAPVSAPPAPVSAPPAPTGVTPAPASATSALPATSLPTGTPATSAAAQAQAAVADGPSVAQAGGEAIDPQYGAIDPTYGQVAERPANPAGMVRNARIGAALLAAGVVLGVIGLFPAYTSGVSLAAQAPNLVPHLIYLAAWAGSAVLILSSGVRRQAGVLIGAGVSVVTLGMFVIDAGTPITYGASQADAGLILSILGWLACAAGAALAWTASGLSFRGWPAGRQSGGQLVRLANHEIVPTVVMVLAAIGAVIAYAPAWDSYLLQTNFGTSQKITLGNAFANPAALIVGSVVVMVLLVAVVAVAALWRPTRLGAALAIGAIIPMVGQAISAMIQVSEPTSPQLFGYSQAQANELGLTITSGLTPMFWVYCAFLGTLILLCVWMLLTPDAVAERAPFFPGLAYPAQPYQGQPYPGQPYPGQPYWSSMTAPSGAVPADAVSPDAVPSDPVPPVASGPDMPSHPAPQQ
jgi:hypothetical protein